MLAMTLLADHPKEAALGPGPPGKHRGLQAKAPEGRRAALAATAPAGAQTKPLPEQPAGTGHVGARGARPPGQAPRAPGEGARRAPSSLRRLVRLVRA